MNDRPACQPSRHDPTSLLLRRLFARAVRLSLLSAAAVSAACGSDDGSAPDWPTASQGFLLASCDAAGGLTPAQPVDSLTVRVRDGDAPLEVRSETGSACATATDRSACEAALANPEGLVPNNIGIDHEVTLFVTTTRGDEVANYDTPDELVRLLGPIDAESEAVLLAQLMGYDVDCSELREGAVRPVDGGFEVVGTRYTSTCDPIERRAYLLNVNARGELTELDSAVISSEKGACVGRRPEGLCSEAVATGESALGDFFAHIAHLEAASVHAFLVLARELEALNAPRWLVEHARRAARDEVRHAMLMRRLALRFQGTVTQPRIEERPLRSLAELARDNAVEGCVRETWGALYGSFQAERAGDRDVRQVMRIIAHDETRHASLAWQIAAWAEPQLAAHELAELRDAQREAVDALSAAEVPASEELTRVAGAPDRAQTERLLSVLRAELWSGAQRVA